MSGGSELRGRKLVVAVRASRAQQNFAAADWLVVILSFQSGLVHNDAQLSVAGKYQVGMRYRPMRRVGVCIPGGAAAYPSSLLMTVVPAQAAGALAGRRAWEPAARNQRPGTPRRHPAAPPPGATARPVSSFRTG